MKHHLFVLLFCLAAPLELAAQGLGPVLDCRVVNICFHNGFCRYSSHRVTFTIASVDPACRGNCPVNLTRGTHTELATESPALGMISWTEDRNRFDPETDGDRDIQDPDFRYGDHRWAHVLSRSGPGDDLVWSMHRIGEGPFGEISVFRQLDCEED